MSLIRSNIFSNDQINQIYDAVNKEFETREQIDWYDSKTGSSYPDNKKFIAIKKENLSRLDIDKLSLSDEIISVVEKYSQEICSDIGLKIKGVVGTTYVEYNPKYGDGVYPHLNAHKDHPGASDFVLDYQLDANVNWEIGINKDIYSLSNNDALGIVTTKNYHWRAKRKWEDGEYVKMLFFHIALEDRNINDCEYSIEEIWNFAEEYNGGSK